MRTRSPQRIHGSPLRSYTQYGAAMRPRGVVRRPPPAPDTPPARFRRIRSLATPMMRRSSPSLSSCSVANGEVSLMNSTSDLYTLPMPARIS
jgi:hypothetical protein